MSTDRDKQRAARREVSCDDPAALPPGKVPPVRPPEPCSPPGAVPGEVPGAVPGAVPDDEFVSPSPPSQAPPVPLELPDPLEIPNGSQVASCAGDQIGSSTNVPAGTYRETLNFASVPGINTNQLEFLRGLTAPQRETLADPDTELAAIKAITHLSTAQASYIQTTVAGLKSAADAIALADAQGQLDCQWPSAAATVTCEEAGYPAGAYTGGNAPPGQAANVHNPSGITAGLYFSSVSQLQADAAAQTAAAAALKCLYGNAAVTRTCADLGYEGDIPNDSTPVTPDGRRRVGSVTVTANTVFSKSGQDDANTKAQALAESGLDCFYIPDESGGPFKLSCEDRGKMDTAAGPADIGAGIPGNPVVVPPGTFVSYVSQAEAEEQALALAETFLDCYWINALQSAKCEPVTITDTQTGLPVIVYPQDDTPIEVPGGYIQSYVSQADADDQALLLAESQLNCVYCNTEVKPKCTPAAWSEIVPVPPSEPDRSWSMDATRGVAANFICSVTAQDAQNIASSIADLPANTAVGSDCCYGNEQVTAACELPNPDEAPTSQLYPCGLKAHFTATGTVGEVPLNVSVNASGSLDGREAIASYGWAWGDGTVGTGATGNHAYPVPGTYTIVLTVTDAAGNTNTMILPVTAVAEGDPVPPAPTIPAAPVREDYLCPPVAHFLRTPKVAELSGGTVNVGVDAATSLAGFDNITSYEWDWGDGSAGGTGSTADHDYTAAGTYSIILTVTDDGGNVDSITRTVLIVAELEDGETLPDHPEDAAYSPKSSGPVTIPANTFVICENDVPPGTDARDEATRIANEYARNSLTCFWENDEVPVECPEGVGHEPDDLEEDRVTIFSPDSVTSYTVSSGLIISYSSKQEAMTLAEAVGQSQLNCKYCNRGGEGAVGTDEQIEAKEAIEDAGLFYLGQPVFEQCDFTSGGGAGSGSSAEASEHAAAMSAAMAGGAAMGDWTPKPAGPGGADPAPRPCGECTFALKILQPDDTFFHGAKANAFAWGVRYEATDVGETGNVAVAVAAGDTPEAIMAKILAAFAVNGHPGGVTRDTGFGGPVADRNGTIFMEHGRDKEGDFPCDVANEHAVLVCPGKVNGVDVDNLPEVFCVPKDTDVYFFLHVTTDGETVTAAEVTVQWGGNNAGEIPQPYCNFSPNLPAGIPGTGPPLDPYVVLQPRLPTDDKCDQGWGEFENDFYYPLGYVIDNKAQSLMLCGDLSCYRMPCEDLNRPPFWLEWDVYREDGWWVYPGELRAYEAPGGPSRVFVPLYAGEALTTRRKIAKGVGLPKDVWLIWELEWDDESEYNFTMRKVKSAEIRLFDAVPPQGLQGPPQAKLLGTLLLEGPGSAGVKVYP